MTLSNGKKQKASMIPSGNGFMPRVSLKRLERIHRKEKAGKPNNDA